MAYPTLYPAQANSPQTEIFNEISPTETKILVQDASVLPIPPTYLVFGADTDSAETVLFTEGNGNTITVVRGIEGQSQIWPGGTKIARNFTAVDHNALIEWAETLKTAVQRIPNRNLLINPNFSINQRGQSAYRSLAAYTLDGYVHVSNDANDLSTLTVNPNGAGGILLDGKGRIAQRLDMSETNLLGCTVTLSVELGLVLPGMHGHIALADDAGLGSVYGIRHITPEDSNSIVSCTGTVTDATKWVIHIASTYADMHVKRVKLELGTESTLAYDAPPDPALELAKCQRYFVRYYYNQYETIGISAYCSTWLNLQLSLPVPMRVKNPHVTATCDVTRINDNLPLGTHDHVICNGTMVNIGYARNDNPGASYLFAGQTGYIDFDANL